MTISSPETRESSALKTFSFDEKLKTENIRYIGREEVDMYRNEIYCNRCEHQLRYVNTIRIDNKYYQIGDFCYDSIKNILSELWGISLAHVKIRLNEGYDRYLQQKYSNEIKDLKEREVDCKKFHPAYTMYEALKYDADRGILPDIKVELYNKLKKLFEN